MRALAVSLALLGTVAHAEAAWLASQARLSARSELAAFGGPRSIGLSFLRADEVEGRRGIGVEAAWLINDRVAEVSTVRRWQLNPTGFATFGATAGLVGWVVPEGRFDLGIGPLVGVSLALGGSAFSLHAGVLSGIDLFMRGPARFSERLQLGVRSELGRVTVGLSGRAGVDLIPGRNFILRADAVLSLGLRSAAAE